MSIQYMIGNYDYRIVALSVAVAILASYTALDLAGRIQPGRKGRGYGWLCAGALAMGTGVWSMHFVGMLAFKLPIEMGYDFRLTALSWLMAVVASAIALYIASRAALSLMRLLAGATVMAVGIAAMHYTGMYAMLMQPGIVYDPWWVMASLIIAWAASAAALWVAFFLRDTAHARGFVGKAGAAPLMGLAIAGMHYVGMEAAQFPLAGVCGAASALDAGWLATLVAASSIALLATALAAAALDRRVEKRTAELVDSLRQANEELRYVSSHDPLTKLANRTLLHERIEAALGRWQQEQATFAIAYVDLDGFKVLNDNLGHQLGDELLKRAGQAMIGAVRHGDTVARIGGDEFVLVLNEMRSQEALAIACTRILDAVASIQEGSARLSASIGSAFCPDDGTDASELMTASDLAMYAAKMAGKNRYQRYRQTMTEQISEEFRIQEDLRQAIDAGHLVVYYQPKYTTADRKLIGAEALVRWQHPEKGMIPPDRFIYIAERCGLINDLETYVLDSVCAHIRLWLDSGYQVPPISVNLSAVRIRDEDLPERVQACLDEHNVEPKYLMFEITESLAVREILRAINALKRFKAMGVDVALDDFGTGHSSLSYLKQLPIQQLKIDRSFIADLGQDDEDQVEIVRSIIALAHALRLRVVAEGVETEEQLIYLNQFGCDEVQGYLFSRPIPAADFVRMICGDMSSQVARNSKVVPLQS